MNKRLIISFISSVTIFIIIALIYFGTRRNLKNKSVYINQIEWELNEKVIDKTRINNTCYLFKTDKNNAFMIDQMTRNGIYQTFGKNELFVLLNVNDSISKKADNDTIYVYKGNKEYYFVAGKVINH